MNISEFALIRIIQDNLITTHPGLICGIGDDCAVLKKDARNVYLVSTDCLIENVHFDLSYCSFIDLGKKALSVNLSDIAAMGGRPLYAFITLGIPPKIHEGHISDFYTGIDQLAREFAVTVAGGDISRSPNYFFISITIVGDAPKNNVKYRSGAKEGDGIYVSGCLGSAAVGLAYFNRRRRVENNYIQAIKNPRPRIHLAQMLSEIQDVHAMIDVSDGFLQDLGHVVQASKVRARVQYDQIPHEADFEKVCRDLRIDPVETLLTGGEDYQLIFTMAESGHDALMEQLQLNKGFKVTRVGEILDGDKKQLSLGLKPCAEIEVLDHKGQEIFLKKSGFDHFGGG